MADFVSLLGRLIRHGVKFVIVGGFAAVSHGCTLLTMDIDVCCDMTPENLLRLQAAVADLHPVHRMTPQRQPLALTAETCKGFKNIYLDTDMGQLDCLGSVAGIGDFAAVERRSVAVEITDGRCLVLALDALIHAKRVMNRPRDIEAVRQLEAIRDCSDGGESP